jgi:hypothetical protein
MKAKKAISNFVAWIGIILGVWCFTAVAHHGDAGRYDETITTLTGTVIVLQLINPHSLLILDVEDQDGNMVRWQAEFSNAASLARIGWTTETLKPDDAVVVAGRRVKSGAPYINLSERARIFKLETCEDIYRSGMIFGEAPDYPAPACSM